MGTATVGSGQTLNDLDLSLLFPGAQQVVTNPEESATEPGGSSSIATLAAGASATRGFLFSIVSAPAGARELRARLVVSGGATDTFDVVIPVTGPRVIPVITASYPTPSGSVPGARDATPGR